MNFTIITPSHNQGEKIRECIDSVIYQEGNFEIEYYIFDNESNDETENILKEYKEKYQNNELKIKCNKLKLNIIIKKDNGQAKVVSKGFKKASNDIISWLNTDDRLEKGALEKIKNEFEKTKKEIIFGNGTYINLINNQTTYSNIKDISLEKMLVIGNHIFQPATFFLKTSYKKHPIDTNLKFLFDYDLWIKFMKDKKYGFLEEKIAKFYIWQKSKTYNNKKDFFIENKKILLKHRSEIGAFLFIIAVIRIHIQYFLNKFLPNFYDKLRRFIRRSKKI